MRTQTVLVGNIPNKQTKKAIYEAENNINLTPIKDLKVYKKKLINSKENV